MVVGGAPTLTVTLNVAAGQHFVKPVVLWALFGEEFFAPLRSPWRLF